MTHTVCTQIKPSLSVRTRALTNKSHIRLSGKQSLLSDSFNLHLRHRNRGVEKKNHLKRRHVFLNRDGCVSETKLPIEDNSLEGQSVINLVKDTSASSVSSASSGSNGVPPVCKWRGCECDDVDRTQLVNHIQQMHVLPQLSSRRKYFCCLWQDCRVFGRPSVSSAWIEQHILHHTDAKGKPFRCIFDSCTLRFSTSTLLERHVQRTHMRTNRVSSDSLSKVSITGNTILCPQQSEKMTTLRNSIKKLSVKKNLRKRKKARVYRVRRVDFYDYRSQILIKNKLKISYLLNKELTIKHNNGRSRISPLDVCNLPSILCEKPINSRLRNNVNPPNTMVNKESSLSSLLKNTKDIHQHISLLLTTPHTFVGQRISLDHRCEFLVRWIGGYGQNAIPPTWIFEEELKVAAHLESIL
ncbi:Zinc finger protein jing isoform 2 [Schistosoma japonicum]|uniref:Zinc finger protein jing isoform 2 n=1 Tax=Schistosoma japonicum TaxID=6182 RepID=A0A4Z2DTT1_SCHJA|nr:Zinc finger protein AEBP2 [Schistosoma japonicum]KAH8865064.1 Zinc finger protein AEBP2 [Schistosoma japonicum]TNN19936.1 Zinc finger protein jing isoform 2 [Schistosoma japonicum]